MSDDVQVAGRVGPFRESHEPRLNGLELLADGVTPVSGFMKFDLTHGQTNVGMAYNAELGCCGFSAWQHLNALKSLFAGDANWMQISLLSWCPKFETLPDAYYAYGIAQGEPGPHPDQGVDNATMLAWAYKLGLIDGYFEVPKGYEDWFTITFNGSLIGQGLDGQVASNDFNANPRIPWDTMPQTDGHDTVLAIGDGEGGGAELTWGGVQPFTPGYRQTNWTDCWVIVDKDDTNVNYQALSSILTEMHGVVNPVQSVEDTESLLKEVEHAIKSVPSHILDSLKHAHKLEEAIAEGASIKIITQIVEDLIKTYAKGVL